MAAQRTAGRSVRAAANSRWLDRTARFGLVCRGVLYVVIGILAVQISFGSGGREADESGAIAALATKPFGMVALWLLLGGFVALGLWQLAEAVFSSDGALARVEAAGRVGLYGVLVASLGKLLLAGEEVKSGDAQARDVTAWLLDLPAGQLIIGAVGIGVCGLGIYWAYKGLSRRFLRDLHTERMTRRTRSAVSALGLVGYVARGLIGGLAGVFLVQAAVQYEPDRAKGLDATLRSFADAPLGPWLLTAIAVGLLLFAGYCLAEARWHRV
jgi:hypothetical protein